MKMCFCVGEQLLQMCDNDVLKISGPSGKPTLLIAYWNR